ncbi:hypothetical protein OAS30_00600 [Candidatus Pelagibacter sp.]|nr:hypothetical protein [Candidatus Pelagibacter sp.]
MSRIMNRPMFRKGGSAGEGITSGLAPRQGYATNEDNTVKQNDLSKMNLKDLNMQQIKDLADSMAFKAPPMQPDNSLRDFKIDFGLDLVSRSPQGNIFQTAGAAAKEPFANFRNSRAAYNKAANERAVNRYNSQTGMFDTLLGAQAKILGSDGGSKTFAKQANDAEIQALMTSLFELEAAQKTDQALSDEEYAQQQAILMQRLQGYTGKNPAVTSLFGNKEQADIVIQGIQNDITNSEAIIKVMGPDGEMIEVVEGEYANENPKYIAEETAKRYITLYNKMIKESMGLAEGGRAKYNMGGDVMEEQVTEVSETMPKETAPTGDGLSYEELRGRLPKEITDDIVVILAESPQALVDFAEIQTQTDVDEFNMKYGVNLSLPSGA